MMKDERKTKKELLNELSFLRKRISKLELLEKKREQFEDDLHFESDLSKTILEFSPTFFVTISADGTIIMMNDTMLATLGYTLNEVIGKDYISHFVPEFEQAKVLEIFKNLMKTRKPILKENYVLKKDGSILLVEWHGCPICNNSGEFTYFIGIGIDITARRQSEDELKETKDYLDSRVFSSDSPWKLRTIFEFDRVPGFRRVKSSESSLDSKSINEVLRDILITGSLSASRYLLLSSSLSV